MSYYFYLSNLQMVLFLYKHGKLTFITRVKVCLGRCLYWVFLCYDIWLQFFCWFFLLLQYLVNQGSNRRTVFCLFCLFFVEKKNLYGPFLWMGFNCLKARATLARQFIFYHKVPRNSWYSFYRPQMAERLRQPLSHPAVLNTGPLDWESRALTTRPLLQKYGKKCFRIMETHLASKFCTG